MNFFVDVLAGLVFGSVKEIDELAKRKLRALLQLISTNALAGEVVVRVEFVVLSV